MGKKKKKVVETNRRANPLCFSRITLLSLENEAKVDNSWEKINK